jgi:hypothetical protein
VSRKQVLEILDVVDSPEANGPMVREVFVRHSWDDVITERVEGPDGATDFIKIVIPL